VRRGVPFRETHHIAGAAVKMAEDQGFSLSDLSPAQLSTLHPLFEDDVAAVWDFQQSAESRDSEGGTSRRSVLEQVEKLRQYALKIGLAFQVIDDILDCTQTSEQLGKTAGKDLATAKTTYPSLMGLEKSKQVAVDLISDAKACLADFEPAKAAPLVALADYIGNRQN